MALVLIPQSLAYAELAGLPAYVGLFAAGLPLIAASLFASSPYLQTGPVAMTALLTLAALSQFGVQTGTAEYVKLAALLALMVGVLRVFVGLIGGGVLAYLMSQPVVVGFTTAAAILIVFSQLPEMLGVVDGDGSLAGEAFSALRSLGEWNASAVAISLVTLIIIIGGKRVHPLFPGVLVAVIVAIIYSAVTDFGGETIAAIPTQLPPFSLDLPWDSFGALVVPAIVVAIIGFAEPAAIARTYATLDREAWDPNREFVSQGVANVVAGVTGAFPVGGSFSRSAIAHISGAQTRATGAIAGVAVLLFLPFSAVLQPLPSAALGAIVVASVYKLANVRGIVNLFKYSKLQAFVAVATFTLTLVLAPRIDLAVIVGTLIGVGIHLWRELRLDIESWTADGIVHVRPFGVLYFGSAATLADRINAELASHADVSHVHIELQRLGRIDYTGALALKRVATEAEEVNVTLHLAGIPSHSRKTLTNVWESELPEASLSEERYLG